MDQLDHESRDRLLNLVVLFARSRYCGAAKLFRLMYLLDVAHFQQTGTTVTGDQYRAYMFGPGPDHLYALLERGLPPELAPLIRVEQDPSIDFLGRRFSATEAPNAEHFTRRQIEIANALLALYDTAHYGDIDLTADRGAYADTWMSGRGRGEVVDFLRTIDPSDARAEYVLARYREDQLRARTVSRYFSDRGNDA